MTLIMESTLPLLPQCSLMLIFHQTLSQKNAGKKQQGWDMAMVRPLITLSWLFGVVSIRENFEDELELGSSSFKQKSLPLRLDSPERDNRNHKVI